MEESCAKITLAARRQSSKVIYYRRMSEVPVPPSRRRHPTGRSLTDGAYALVVLLLAVGVGVGLLVAHQQYPDRSGPLLPVAAAIPRTGIPSESFQPNPASDSGPAPTESAEPPLVAPAPTPEPPLTPTPWPSPVTGRVLDDRRHPLAGASVVADDREVQTGATGTFSLDQVSAGTPLIIKLPGYVKKVIPPPAEPTTEPIETVLEPQVIKGVYLTYYGASDRRIRGRVLDLVERTELNAVVIDVKGDRGWILYPTEVPLAIAAGAQGPATMREFDTLMTTLKARGIYTIARIVTFKDQILANYRPDLAVIDTRTGKPWVDRERLAWLDPFQEEAWDYNIALAREAVRRGFDEVQFDYVRFPTDGKLSAARYAKPNSRETRLPAIVGFLSRARRELGAMGAFVAADIFGYTAFNESDTDIGQRIEDLAPHLDYICPMVYPSGYHLGIPGYRNPVQHPYEVVRESVRLIRKRSTPSPGRIRPWLQDFRDYAFGRRIFGASEIQAQIRGADEGGATGWMLWNPRNTYTGGALRPEAGVAAATAPPTSAQD